MKNIHVLPTDKQSRLFKLAGDLHLHEECGIDPKRNKNIYITSDEEIKEGDWVIYTNGIVHCQKMDYKEDLSNVEEFNAKKIILTTDQDLIKDGVQAIDDEFLEWFFKNRNCEEVEVDYQTKDFINECWVYDYKIIIPKEEPKQDLEKEMFELEQELDIPSHLRWHNSKPKQETLEEAKQNYFNKCVKEVRHTWYCVEDFNNGAKWQQDNSNINALNFEIDALKKQIELLKYQEQDKNKFSKDDIIEAFYTDSREWKNSCKDYVEVDFNKWFEKFKKK